MDCQLVENEHGWWVVDHRNDEHGPFPLRADAEAERSRIREFSRSYETEDPRPMGTPSER